MSKHGERDTEKTIKERKISKKKDEKNKNNTKMGAEVIRGVQDKQIHFVFSA